MSTSSRIAHLGAAAAIGVVGYYLYTTLIAPSDKKKSSASEQLNLPVVDFNLYLDREKNAESNQKYKEECKRAANALHEYGVCVVRDPRVVSKDNDTFIDMMERYFGLSDWVRDARPEWHFQVGVTPAFEEKPRDNSAYMDKLQPSEKPVSPKVPIKDSKARFFWRIGPRPTTTKFASLNMDPVIPPEIPEWKETMDMWGNKMLSAVEVLSEMLAEGFDLPSDAFTSRMKCGPHLLAPTGSDYATFNKEGTILAGFHTDLNFLTIHGKSRYPGLSIWTRTGQRMSVVVPEGCLLVQAGKQIEYLTGGHVMAGYHEVVINKATIAAIEKKKAAGGSLWRVSSTLFGHINSDQILEPLGKFANPQAKKLYPPKFTGDQVREELEAINLSSHVGKEETKK